MKLTDESDAFQARLCGEEEKYEAVKEAFRRRNEGCITPMDLEALRGTSFGPIGGPGSAMGFTTSLPSRPFPPAPPIRPHPAWESLREANEALSKFVKEDN